jgi:hypothetical protein
VEEKILSKGYGAFKTLSPENQGEREWVRGPGNSCFRLHKAMHIVFY